jgi:hypothetical protein
MTEHFDNKRGLSRLLTVGQLLGSTSAITVYTCPAHFETEVQLLLVNNLHTGVVDLTVKGVISSTNVPIVTTYSMAADAILDVLNSRPIALKAADTLVVTAGTASKLNVTVTVRETCTG